MIHLFFNLYHWVLMRRRPHHGTVPQHGSSRSSASTAPAAWLCAATVAMVAVAQRRRCGGTWRDGDCSGD